MTRRVRVSHFHRGHHGLHHRGQCIGQLPLRICQDDLSGIQSQPLIERMDTMNNLLRKVLKYLDLRRFKCVGKRSVNRQLTLPATLDAKRNINAGAYAEPRRPFAPGCKDIGCLGVRNDLELVGANTDA